MAALQHPGSHASRDGTPRVAAERFGVRPRLHAGDGERPQEDGGDGSHLRAERARSRAPRLGSEGVADADRASPHGSDYGTVGDLKGSTKDGGEGGIRTLGPPKSALLYDGDLSRFSLLTIYSYSREVCDRAEPAARFITAS